MSSASGRITVGHYRNRSSSTCCWGERAAAIACAHGWPTSRSSGCGEILWVRHAGGNGAGTLPGRGHGTLFAAMRIVLPTEGDRTLCNSEQRMVGVCCARVVTGKVMEDMFRAAKGGLGIDTPVLPREPVEEGTELLWLASAMHSP